MPEGWATQEAKRALGEEDTGSVSVVALAELCEIYHKRLAGPLEGSRRIVEHHPVSEPVRQAVTAEPQIIARALGTALRSLGAAEAPAIRVEKVCLTPDGFFRMEIHPAVAAVEAEP